MGSIVLANWCMIFYWVQCKPSHIHGNYYSQVTVYTVVYSSVYIDTQYTPYYSTTIVSLIHAM